MRLDSLSHLALPLSSHAPLDAAAHSLVARHAGELPDLSHLVVLLPSLHAAQPFAQALVAAADRPTLLLPTLTTLPQWAAASAPPQALIANSARQGLIYAALRERPNWFREADLWAISGELLKLFDEITLNQVPLPQQESDFVARLAQAYQARAGESLQFEARLIHELWYALQRTLGDRIDHASAYQRRLAYLADHARHPLYGIGIAELARCEVEFFQRYAERAPVTLYQPTPLLDDTPTARVLAAAWQQSEAGIRQRAAHLCQTQPVSPLADRLRLFPAHSLEEQARAADTRIRQWLLAGKRRIAVVAQDRLAARRVRALLERAQVLVEDETGWTLSTTAASSVIMRWCDLISGDFFHQDLLDFLKSPLVFADWEAGTRKQAVYELEQLIREKSLVSRLIHYRAAAHEKDAACGALLERLHQAQRVWPRKAQSLAAWLDTLQQTLDTLGITSALAADLAGMQLLATLGQLREELREETGKFQFNEWRRWLDRQLETATFRDTGIASPVVFTHLPATRLRPFDAVLLLGCDAEHLPARGSDGLFFNQSVRAQLGLPTREAALAIEQQDLAKLLAGGAELLVTWQRMADGEEHLPSPYFELLQTVHTLAWQDDLLDAGLAAQAAAAVVVAPETAPRTPSAQPRPTLPSARVPQSISASGYNSLMGCPYQYYARHALKLNDMDEVQLAMEKRDFGELVHRILLAFHQDNPVLGDTPLVELERRLRAISADTFGPMLKLNYLSHAWKLRWDALIPDYLGWQLQREAEGWRWHGGEVDKRLALALPDGQPLTLRGTLDRIDQHGAALAVLDYKTRAPTALRAQLKAAGEDVQLPVYALLAEADVSTAAYVSLEREGVKTVPLDADLTQLARDVAERLTTMFAALHAGAALPAQGTDDACRWCDMRGLCRRDYWREAQA